MDNAAAARRLVEILGIDTEPVAVFLLGPESPPPTESFRNVNGYRYCQLLMRARHGESVFDLNVAGGERRRGDTAVLQATCVDATLIPYLEQRLNFSLGCYGCREATDLGAHESVLGFPGARLEPLLAALESLENKAVGRSRSKSIFENLNKKEGYHE